MKKRKKINIGFILNYRLDGWMGVTNYYLNLIDIINKQKKNKIRVNILTDHNITSQEVKKFKNCKVIKTNLLNRKSRFLKMFNLICILFFRKNFFLENFLIKKNIDIISHTTSLGKYSKIPSIKWFPDFQEISFPKNFSLKQKIARRLSILFSITNSTMIIVSSKTVMKDLKLISMKGYHKCKILYHSTFIKNLKLKKMNFLKKKYDLKNIKKDFLFLPNHHWKHKNHIIVYKALHYLNLKYKKKIYLITSGNLNDYRFPNHQNYLNNFVIRNNLTDQIINLGIINYDEVLSFMSHSSALINPSYIEGWGNMIDQANYFKKLIFVSKNPVHLEQNPKHGIFFNSNSHLDLAIKLKNFFFNKTRIKNIKFKNPNLSIENFYEDYSNIIESLVKKR